MERAIDAFIQHHFETTNKALLLTGARQVGKTYAVRKYAQRMSFQLVEMNFLLQPDVKNIFVGAKDVKDLLLRISAYANRPLEKENTLLFFDEIQEYADALTWVKAIVDDGSFKCALSGSLLGLELKNVRSVPVGYLVEKQMYPIDFEEFIRAIGISGQVICEAEKSWEKRVAVDDFIHSKLMQLFNLYLIVGGMPAAVQVYLDTNDLQRVIMEQKAILGLYKRDIARYDPNEKLYINDIFELIPSELNSKNKRFILKKLNEHIKFSRHENSFTWLRDADMAMPVYNVDEPVSPLKLSESRSLFKLFQNDVGLLACQYAGGIQLKILEGNVTLNFGAIFENVVAQELHAHGWNLHYFNSKKQGEIDFLIERDGDVIPIEVKSGKDYQRHNALSNIMSNEAYSLPEAIVLGGANLSQSGRIVYAPMYMTMFIRKEMAAEPMLYKVDLSGLI